MKADLIELCRSYRAENMANRYRKLKWSEAISEPDRLLCRRAADRYLSADNSKRERIENALQLHQATVSPLDKLFRSILENDPAGLDTLLQIRADLIDQNHRRFFPMVYYQVTCILQVCLNPGMLCIRQVSESDDMRLKRSVADAETVRANSPDLPGLIIDLIISYIRLNQNLTIKSGRRVIALLHPKLTDTPLTVLHVALADCNRLPTTISNLISGDYKVGDSVCNAAVCYSISNGHKGASQFGLAGYTIHQAILKLRVEFSNIKAVITLSPIPGFRRWIETQKMPWSADLFTRAMEDGSVLNAHKDALIQSCMQYLTRSGLDPVYRFHTQNGARLAGIYWGADLRRTGVRNSFGIMSRYEYENDGRSVEPDTEIWKSVESFILRNTT